MRVLKYNMTVEWAVCISFKTHCEQSMHICCNIARSLSFAYSYSYSRQAVEYVMLKCDIGVKKYMV